MQPMLAETITSGASSPKLAPGMGELCITKCLRLWPDYCLGGTTKMVLPPVPVLPLAPVSPVFPWLPVCPVAPVYPVLP